MASVAGTLVRPKLAIAMVKAHQANSDDDTTLSAPILDFLFERKASLPIEDIVAPTLGIGIG